MSPVIRASSTATHISASPCWNSISTKLALSASISGCYQSPPWLRRERVRRRDPLRHSGSPATPHLARLQLRRGGTGAGLCVAIRGPLASQRRGRWSFCAGCICIPRSSLSVVRSWSGGKPFSEHNVERWRMLLNCDETALKRIDDLLSQDIIIRRPIATGERYGPLYTKVARARTVRSRSSVDNQQNAPPLPCVFSSLHKSCRLLLADL